MDADGMDADDPLSMDKFVTKGEDGSLQIFCPACVEKRRASSVCDVGYGLWAQWLMSVFAWIHRRCPGLSVGSESETKEASS